MFAPDTPETQAIMAAFDKNNRVRLDLAPDTFTPQSLTC